MPAAPDPADERRRLRQAVALRRALRAGLQRDELFVQYQPIVPLRAAGRPQHPAVEALVRWRHPQLGVLPPRRFLPAAERGGLIRPLGDAVLTIALRQMHRWLQTGPAPPCVAVNVSALQLRAPGFAAAVLHRLQQEEVSPSRLMLELTEAARLDGRVVTENLHRLSAEGVRLAIDDFGVGHSCLRYLRELPVHALKIDRVFVQAIAGNRRDAAIVAAIVALARTLGLWTVAEGIETEAQRATLAGLGCDFGQGWLFGRPR